MQEKVLAEAKLAEDRGIRVIRDEVGDYCTEYAEGEYGGRSTHRDIHAAMEFFTKVVLTDEIATMAMEYGVRV